MNQMVATNVKQLVLTQGTFGPQEIHQIVRSPHRRLAKPSRTARGGQRDGGQRRSQPGGRGAAGRLPVSAGPIQPGLRHAQDRRRRRSGPFLSRQDLRRAGRIRAGVQSYTAAAKAGYDADICALARAEVLRVSGQSEGGFGRARQDARRRRTDGRVSLPAGRDRGRLARQPDRSDRALRAGRRGRSEAFRGAVRPGHGQRSPRQRRHGHGSLRAVGRPLSRASRFAAEPGHLVRRSAAVRTGAEVLPADSGFVSEPSAGPAVLQRRGGLARACSTTKTPSAAAIG